MNPPSEQNHWAKLALELGATVPESAPPKQPPSASSLESSGVQEPPSPAEPTLCGEAPPQVDSPPPQEGPPSAEPKKQAGRSGLESRPVVSALPPAKEAKPRGGASGAKGGRQGPPARTPSQPASHTSQARSPAHWLELAKQLGVEVPPEMQVLPSEPDSGPAKSVLPESEPARSETELLPEKGPPSEGRPGRKVSGEKCATGSAKSQRPPESPRPRSGGPAHPEAKEGKSFSESRSARSEVRKTKRRRKKHRREKPEDQPQRKKTGPSADREPRETTEKRISDFPSGPSVVEQGAGKEEWTVPSGPGLAEQADVAEIPFSEVPSPLGSACPEGQTRAPFQPIMGEQSGEETFGVGVWEGPAPLSEGPGEPLVEVPSPIPAERKEAGERSGFGAGEPILLPPPPVPTPTLSGPDKPPTSAFLAEPLARPEDLPTPPAFLEPEEIPHPEDLFEISEEDQETETAEQEKGKAGGSEKPIHRGVPTWKEVMDLIISANVQNRTRRSDRGGSGRGGSSRSGH